MKLLRVALRVALHLGPVAFYTLVIFFLGSIRMGPHVPGSLTDKWLHLLAFGVYIPILLLADFFLRRSRSVPDRLIASTAVSSTIGMVLEFWQLLWPTRTFEVLDWVADTAGAILVSGIFYLVFVAWTRLMATGRVEQLPPSA